MMLVIGNGKLFTRNDEMPFVENGAVAIEGTKIAAVGETEAIKKQYGDAEFIEQGRRDHAGIYQLRMSTFTVRWPED